MGARARTLQFNESYSVLKMSTVVKSICIIKKVAHKFHDRKEERATFTILLASWVTYWSIKMTNARMTSLFYLQHVMRILCENSIII